MKNVINFQAGLTCNGFSVMRRFSLWAGPIPQNGTFTFPQKGQPSAVGGFFQKTKSKIFPKLLDNLTSSWYHNRLPRKCKLLNIRSDKHAKTYPSR